MMIMAVVVVTSCRVVRDWRQKRPVFSQWNLSLTERDPGSLYPWLVACPAQIRMQPKDANITRLQCSTYNTITQSTGVTPV
jgi:hypothetical protein